MWGALQTGVNRVNMESDKNYEARGKNYIRGDVRPFCIKVLGAVNYKIRIQPRGRQPRPNSAI